MFVRFARNKKIQSNEKGVQIRLFQSARLCKNCSPTIHHFTPIAEKLNNSTCYSSETNKMLVNSDYAKAQWKINISVIKKVVIFHQSVLDKIDEILETPKSDSQTHHELCKFIKTELDFIFKQLPNSHLFLEILHFKIFKNNPNCHIDELPEFVRLQIIQNIQTINGYAQLQSAQNPFLVRINGSNEAFQQNEFSNDIVDVRIAFNFKSKCIEITNWLFDKRTCDHFRNYYSLFDIILTLHQILQPLIRIRYMWKHEHVCDGFLFEMFKNTYFCFKLSKPLESIKSTNELLQSINTLFEQFEHAYTIFKCNTNQNTTQKLYELNVIKKLFIDTIHEMQNVTNVEKCRITTVAKTMIEIIENKNKIVFCHEYEYEIEMFSETTTIVDYITNCLFHREPELCLQNDYVVFREKLLFMVVHDMETNSKTAPNGINECCFADSFIGFNIVKFL